MRTHLTPLVVAALAPLAGASANDPHADPMLPAAAARRAPDSLEQALQGRTTWLNLRFRHEHVSQENFNNHANASTLRTLFGITTGSWNGIKVTLEVEDVTPIGPEDYNSTVNGNTGKPVIADPDHTEINQAYVSFGRDEQWALHVGRQKIVLDNKRFIGNVGWRQNMQTYDAATLIFSQPDSVTVHYSYLDNVNRIQGDQNINGDLRSNSHILNVSQDLQKLGRVSAYWYDIDIEEFSPPPSTALQSLSTRTIGARLDGAQEMSGGGDLLYQAEYAVQSDTGSNPTNIDTDYYHASLGWKQGNFTVLAGRESLGGESASSTNGSFQTPLATLHGFNGFADVFLTTPKTGLVDDYIKVAAKLGQVDAAVIYHIFQPESGGGDYGDEWDFVLTYPYSDRMTFGAKYATFDRDKSSPIGGSGPAGTATAPAVNKLMLWMTFKAL